MNNKSFTTSFFVDQTPQEVFEAVSNVRGWWSEAIEGHTDRPGATFHYHFKDIHRCELRIDEFKPNQKVVWHVVDNFFGFTQDSSEWKDTHIIFDIAEKDGKTELRFTHAGLVPEYECYNVCMDGWNTYVNGSLRSLITTGKGKPNVGDAITDSEQALS